MGEAPATAPWTRERVLAGLAHAFAALPPVLRAQQLDLFAIDGQPAPELDLIRLAGEVLGVRSLACVALMMRARAIGRPGRCSLRQLCRERAGWHRSRMALYRWSDRGADRLAAHLSACRDAYC